MQPPSLIFDMKTPSSDGSCGFPGCPCNPPLITMPNFLSGSLLIWTSWKIVRLYQIYRSVINHPSFGLKGCLFQNICICYLTLNPEGRGSCCTFIFMLSFFESKARTASWWEAPRISTPFTNNIRSPMRSFLVLAAAPPGIIWNNLYV